MKIEITFGQTTSTNLKTAVRIAKALPGYSIKAGPKGEIHSIDTSIPFDNSELWEELRELLAMVGSWKTTSLKIDGKEARQSWRTLGEISEVISCYGQRPSDKRGDDYCCGKQTPTDDTTAFGCRFVKGIDFSEWGRNHGPWYHFGHLEDDNSVFRVDKNLILETLKSATEGEYCLACPAYTWQRVESTLEQLPVKIDLKTSNAYSLRYSDADPLRPIGIMRKEEPLYLQVGRDNSDIASRADGTPVRTVPNVRYKDVAGQARAIEVVKDICELPLKYVEYFDHLRLAPHRGIILYGPPGNGKTLLAKAIATESNAHLEIISGPEILSKWVGQSEENLRKVFERARQLQPSVILIDEVDAIAPIRNDMMHHFEAQLVSQLLVLLDGLEDRGKVIVIATTNRLDAIDEAIKRPGRFDYHIQVPNPDEAGRIEILRLYISQMACEHFSIEEVAEMTNGWSGAELVAICREAGLVAIKRAIATGLPAQETNISKADMLAGFMAVHDKRKIVCNSSPL
jgi:AAA+ superfamily predicted ATPase